MPTSAHLDIDVDEDDELEWQRIADAVNVIEQQYIDARGYGNRTAPIDGPQTLHSSPLAPTQIPAASTVRLADQLDTVAQPAQDMQNPETALIRNHPALSSVPPHHTPSPIIPPASSMPGLRAPIPVSNLVSSFEIERLKAIVQEQDGSLANHQNRLRGMQQELNTLRAKNYDQVRIENARLNSALTMATTESARLQEKLSYAELELASLRDRRRAEAVSMAEAKNPSGTQVPGTQVPGTQVPSTLMIATQADRTHASSTQAFGSKQAAANSKASSIRAPRRRKRPHDTKRSVDYPQNDDDGATQISAPQAPKYDEETTIVTASTGAWSVNLKDATGRSVNAALRRYLFSGTAGVSLWQLARVAGQDRLRNALMCGMSCDEEWPRLLEPMALLLEAGRGARLTALRGLYGLLVFSEGSRRRIGALPAVTTKVLATLKRAAEHVDLESAEQCLLVLNVILDAAVIYGDGEQLIRVKKQIFSDALLHWTRRKRIAQFPIPARDQVLITRVRNAALCVLVAGANICLNSTWPLDEEDWRIFEDALAAASDAIRAEIFPPQTALTMLISAACYAPSTVDEHGVGALADACMHGIQTLRVADVRETERTDSRRQCQEEVLGELRERKKIAGVIHSCIAALVLLSRGGDLVLSKSERNAMLGVLAVLAWPTRRKGSFSPPKELTGTVFVKECREVWMAVRRKEGT